jgi:hypothetical protein
MPEAHRKQLVEGLSLRVQLLVAWHTAATGDDLVQARHVVIIQALRQAKLVKTAQRTFRGLGHLAAPSYRQQQYRPNSLHAVSG